MGFGRNGIWIVRVVDQRAAEAVTTNGFSFHQSEYRGRGLLFVDIHFNIRQFDQWYVVVVQGDGFGTSTRKKNGRSHVFGGITGNDIEFGIVKIGHNYEDDQGNWKYKVVKVSAYNSTRAQTDGLPTLAAWSDTLVPGMKAIAVSRDLITLGLDHNTQVKIEGLDGVFLVKDKMASRMKNKIDIYMGRDIEKAREWGTKTLKIQYRICLLYT